MTEDSITLECLSIPPEIRIAFEGSVEVENVNITVNHFNENTEEKE